MAYFEQNDRGRQGYTRKFSSARVAPTEETEEYGDYDDGFDDGYDDGFDELMEEEPEEEIPEEVRLREKRHKYRVAAGLGDLGATLVGVVVILALVAFLFTMLRFLSSDLSQNFFLLQTRF